MILAQDNCNVRIFTRVLFLFAKKIKKLEKSGEKWKNIVEN